MDSEKNDTGQIVGQHEIINSANDNESHDAEQSDEMRLLKHSFDRIKKLHKYEIFSAGLNEIEKKFTSYETMDEYLGDIKRFARDHSNEKKLIKQLKHEIERDARGIRACAECYQNWMNDRYTYFQKACNRPHLLVLCKFGNSPYWPAKVLSTDRNIATVEFFGDHTQADVSESNCYLYSMSNMNRLLKSTDPAFIEAVKELREHIKNIEQKFGVFKPAGFRVRLDIKFIQKQLKSMFPRAYKKTVPPIERRIKSKNVTSNTANKSKNVMVPSSNDSVFKLNDTAHLPSINTDFEYNNAVDLNENVDQINARKRHKLINENGNVSRVKFVIIENNLAKSTVKVPLASGANKTVIDARALQEENIRLKDENTNLKDENKTLKNRNALISSIDCANCGDDVHLTYCFCSPECMANNS